MDSADLHIHSTASDGLLSPEQIVEWGISKGLRAVSLTDHDNVSGTEAALMRSRDEGIEIVPGIELSTDYYGIEVHILGYFIDYKSPSLTRFLAKLKDSRAERAKEMVKKLNSIGCNISYDDIYHRTKNTVSIGRPHIARAMVDYGYCRSIEDAFEKYIGFGKPAFVDRYKISPYEAVQLISDFKGVSSIAHPGLIRNIEKEHLIKELKDIGLCGIEVYHTKHNREQIRYFHNLADKLHLVPTGGTDCHGTLVNGQPLIGSVSIPYENINKLKECIPKSLM